MSVITKVNIFQGSYVSGKNIRWRSAPPPLGFCRFRDPAGQVLDLGDIQLENIDRAPEE